MGVSLAHSACSMAGSLSACFNAASSSGRRAGMLLVSALRYHFMSSTFSANSALSRLGYAGAAGCDTRGIGFSKVLADLLCVVFPRVARENHTLEKKVPLCRRLKGRQRKACQYHQMWIVKR